MIYLATMVMKLASHPGQASLALWATPQPLRVCSSFQAKETNNKQKEFEETAKTTRQSIEQLAA